MIIKLRAICGEDEDFLREIEISGDSTFLELHSFIQQNLKYDDKQLATFFITDNGWNKEQEITLFDMSDGELSQSLLMEKTTLNNLLTKAKQRFIYIFDLFSERALFIEVIKIDRTAELEAPICTTASSLPPKQIKFDDPSQDPDSIMHDDDSFDDLLYGGELDDDDFGDDEDDFGNDDFGGGYGNDPYGEDY